MINGEVIAKLIINKKLKKRKINNFGSSIPGSGFKTQSTINNEVFFLQKARS